MSDRPPVDPLPLAGEFIEHYRRRTDRPPVDPQVHTRPPAGAVLSVRVPGDLASEIDEDATAAGMSLSEYVRAVLERRNTLTGGSLAVTIERPSVDPLREAAQTLVAEVYEYERVQTRWGDVAAAANAVAAALASPAAPPETDPSLVYGTPEWSKRYGLAVPPEGLDVERLARAIASLGHFDGRHMDPLSRARLIVEADARLSDTGDTCEHMIPRRECRLDHRSAISESEQRLLDGNR